MQTTQEQKPAFKSVDEVQAEFLSKVNELRIDPATQPALLSFFMEENRQAWIRGKEYGWKKAWNWKRRRAETAA